MCWPWPRWSNSYCLYSLLVRFAIDTHVVMSLSDLRCVWTLMMEVCVALRCVEVRDATVSEVDLGSASKLALDMATGIADMQVQPKLALGVARELLRRMMDVAEQMVGGPPSPFCPFSQH